MIGDITVKVCGITRAADAALALDQGADFIGINCWAGSQRFVAPELRKNLLREIPEAKRIAVTVNPILSDVIQLLEEGFAAVQIHFDPQTKACDIAAIAKKVGPEKLWLAPKVADGEAWPPELLKLANTFLHDAHAKDAFGGTGKVSDWKRFQALQKSNPDKNWVLAGGLSPKNIVEAVKAGASILDLNSGVEILPGLKSAEKLSEVRTLLLNIKQS